MRTLLISDLHLGSRSHHDVLRRPGPRAKLIDALDGVDRLVLLGDVIELMARHPRRSMDSAEPIMRSLGRRLGPEREVIVVPGNHDGPLVRAWARAQGRDLAPAGRVDPNATRALGRLVSWLAPAKVTVSYPGVWLADRVWATHGHYLDKHLIPESAFGLPRGRARHHTGAPVPAIEYERGRRRVHRSRESLASRLLARPVATLLESAAEVLRTATMPHLPRLLMQARLTSVTATVIDFQMRHAGIPAMAQVVSQLGVDADWVIFGHVHRCGPLDRDAHWPSAIAGTRFLNTGSWVYEPLLIDRARAPHPYWPGGAVLLEPGREPRTVGLLDGLSADELTGVAASGIGPGPAPLGARPVGLGSG